jgi:hypothetical protein
MYYDNMACLLQKIGLFEACFQHCGVKVSMESNSGQFDYERGWKLTLDKFIIWIWVTILEG